MIDTHAHIYLPDLKIPQEEMLLNAFQVGISHILMPAIAMTSLQQMDELITKNETSVVLKKMAGFHPCEIGKVEIDEVKLTEVCASDDILAIGETGLDYYWDKTHIDDQKKSLTLHCEIAKSTNKPIVIHNRESTRDVLDILEEQQDGRLTGVWHCFNGSVDEGKRAIDFGFKLGIGGVVTFKNGGVDKTVRELSLDEMILETDSPYLSPTPFRGKPNQPAYVELVAKKIAEIFDISKLEVIQKTTDTAKQLFNLE